MHVTPLEIVTGIVSLGLCAGGLAVIPALVRRLPYDYFVRPPPSRSLASKVVRNVAAVLLIAAGVAMLILPGPGVVGLLFGLSILDLPIKHRALRWLLKHDKIQEGLQRLRSKVGKQPFAIPQT